MVKVRPRPKPKPRPTPKKRKLVKAKSNNYATVQYDYNGEDVRVLKYVALAEEKYSVKEHFSAQRERFGIKVAEMLYKYTRLSMKEVSWLLETPYETIRDHIKKYAKVSRDSKKREEKLTKDGRMNAEYIHELAKYGVFHSISGVENIDEDSINKLQRDLTYRGLKMLEFETGGMVTKGVAESYKSYFGAVGLGSDILKDGAGVLKTKDKAMLAIQEKVANLKIDQFELDKKGRNVAVTIIEEYGDNDTLSDTDLIYLIKNFLSSFHEHDEVSKITKQAMATIHHKKGKISDAQFAQIMDVDEDKLEDVMLN